jgi:integrase
MVFFGAWILDERKFLSRDELLRLRRLVRGRVERAGFAKRVRWLEWFLVELALETGLRVFEMAALKCSDMVLSVRRCGVLVRRGKCGKPRFVRIRRAFASECEDFLNWKAAVGESVGREAPIFVSSVTGGHMTTRALQKMFKRLCRRAHVEGHSIHHCRHTYVSHLSEASNYNLPFVQRQAGHADLRTTQTYLHVFDESADRAVEKLYA